MGGNGKDGNASDPQLPIVSPVHFLLSEQLLRQTVLMDSICFKFRRKPALLLIENQGTQPGRGWGRGVGAGGGGGECKRHDVSRDLQRFSILFTFTTNYF